MTRSGWQMGSHRLKALGVAVLAAHSVLAPTHAVAQTIAITGGKVYPVSSAPVESATVLIRNGRIAAVGANVTIPADAERVDATGKWVTPGLINAATGLGVTEIGLVPQTVDRFARGQNNVSAAFTVWEGLNPASTLLAPARDEGITSVALVPGGGLISGQVGVVDLVNGTVSDMLVRGPVAIVAQIENPQAAGTNARGELLVRLREVLEDARVYARRRSAFESGNSREFSVSRLDLAALGPVVQGRLPLMITANRASDIDAALQLARETRIRIMILGGEEGWLVADKLAAANVPVLVGAMSNIPSSFTTLGSRQDNAALLRRAGVQVILIGNGSGDEQSFNVRNVRYEAGAAVAYGMPWDDALRALTLAPAEALGVSDRLGSLRVGRDANVVVWSGDPFEFATRAEHVFLRGRRVEQGSRQDMLMRRYKTLPPNYRTP